MLLFAWFFTCPLDAYCFLRPTYVINRAPWLSLLTLCRFLAVLILWHSQRCCWHFYSAAMSNKILTPNDLNNYLCGSCQKTVKSNQPGVQCEVCYLWCHCRCLGLTPIDYRELQQSDDPWCCPLCFKQAFPFHNCSSISNNSSCFSPLPHLPTPLNAIVIIKIRP